ncbi:MAG: hypothetical protein CLLPBCKN_002382 [Chroococcidiopsis cubana SAG 39.79]|nr:hypothetical protein [Chroococcidiopsis cubana SAG 39.79]
MRIDTFGWIEPARMGKSYSELQYRSLQQQAINPDRVSSTDGLEFSK